MSTSRVIQDARHGKSKKSPTTLEIYTHRYEETMREVAPPLRLELTKRSSPLSMADTQLLDAWYDEDVRARNTKADLERLKKVEERIEDLDYRLTSRVRARLNEKELDWIDMSLDSRDKLERRGMAPKPTLDLLYLELSPEQRVEMASKGNLGPPAPMDIASAIQGVLPSFSGVGSTLAGFASGFLEAAKSAGAAMQPAPATRYMETDNGYSHRMLAPPSNATSSRAPSTRYLEGPSRAPSSRAPSTRYLEAPPSRAPSTRAPTTRHDAAAPARRTEKTPVPSYAATQRAPGRHETAKTLAPTHAVSKMTTRRTEAATAAPSRAETKTKTENKTSRHHGTKAQETEYVNLHISALPSRSHTRK